MLPGLLALCLAALMAGCASGPERSPVGSTPAPRSARDGAPQKPPSDLASLPDPVPRIEPIKRGGPNKPYTVMGQSYEPIAADVAWKESGVASWYGNKFHGRRTASGELFSMYGLTAAHRTLPIPSYARVRHLGTGKSIIVRINDRGPFHSSRVMDLSYAAAVKLGMVSTGSARVEVERLTFDDIRSGVWASEDAQADGDKEPAAVAQSASPARAHTTAQRGYWVQLVAMGQREGVDRLHQRAASELPELHPLLAVFSEARQYKLQAGPYASRREATVAASQARDALQLTPMVIERR